MKWDNKRCLPRKIYLKFSHELCKKLWFASFCIGVLAVRKWLRWVIFTIFVGLVVSHFSSGTNGVTHDDVIKWTHFLRYWPFVRGIHRGPHTKASDAEYFFFICTWINGWVNNREAGDLGHNHAHYYVTVMHERYHYSDSHEHNGVLKPSHLDCLFNFVIVWYKRKHRSPRYRPFCEGSAPMTGWFPSQRAK